MHDTPRVDSGLNWRRLDGIDLLRGVAILFVLLNHVNMRLVLADIPYGRSLPHWLKNGLAWNGQRGVQIFFAVSGFLITSTSLRRWGTLAQVRILDFYRLRFARIAPLLLLLLGILSLLHLAKAHNFVVFASTGGLGRALFAALTFHVNVLEARLGYLPANWDVLWSLSVEETFYLFFPVVARLLGRGRWLIILLCTFVVLGPFARTIFAHHNERWREMSYLGGMDAIALGCLTALLLPEFRLQLNVFRFVRAVGALLLLFILFFSSAFLERTGLDMTLLAFATCALISFAATSPRQGFWLTRPLLWLGERSYEIYLTHMFIVFACFELFLKIGTPSAGIPALFLGATVFAAFLGEAVARFFSEPLNRLLRKRWGEGPDQLGSVIGTTNAAPGAN